MGRAASPLVGVRVVVHIGIAADRQLVIVVVVIIIIIIIVDFRRRGSADAGPGGRGPVGVLRRTAATTAARSAPRRLLSSLVRVGREVARFRVLRPLLVVGASPLVRLDVCFAWHGALLMLFARSIAIPPTPATTAASTAAALLGVRRALLLVLYLAS